ncbi:MAG: bis-aminopropyl spermidine synthase family protein, partial [Deltaproteobacteria bacterium]|nr:bis-aminopropyl spermidine synthase family protein [Deltaproteobacteria bacterium]
RRARAGGLGLRADALDLTRPLPRRALGRYDLVFTDPISTRDGFALFLSRAVSCLRPGGLIFCCAHAAALEVCCGVVAELRLVLRDRLADFNRYYDDTFEIDGYRSDLVVLERTARARALYDPAAPAAADIFRGVASHRQHAWAEVRALPGRPLDLPRLAERLRQVTVASPWAAGPGALHQTAAGLRWLVVLRGGGHLALSVDRERGLLAVSVFPFDDARDNAIYADLARAMGSGPAGAGHLVAAPDRRLLESCAAVLARERGFPIL